MKVKKRDLALLLGLGLAGFLILLSFYAYSLYTIVVDRFEGDRWYFPSKIYSDSFILHEGQDIHAIQLLDRLKRLGYQEVASSPESNGEYWLEDGSIEIFLKNFSYPDQEFQGFPVHLKLESGRIASIQHRREAKALALVELEPELIAAIYDETWEERDLLQVTDVPDELIQAILAAEDKRFFSHFGIDPWGVARALWVNLKNLAILQGGSTLTQQLVKNFYLNQERTLVRKLNEAIMAILLEVKYPKEEILEAYLNEIYMGQSGLMGIFGFGEAARYYFEKDPGDLTLGESALLAGVIKSPNLYSPFNQPENASRRRTHVLDRMRKLGWVSHEAYLEALRENIPEHPPAHRHREAPYFVDFVRQELGEDYHPSVLHSQGLNIFTSLDLGIQKNAERSLETRLSELEDLHPELISEDSQDRLQGLVVVLQPQTGTIKAMVGGRNYSETQFNRATHAMRQPGSLFKLFVYAAAISKKSPSGNPLYTGASILDDSPFILVSGDKTWQPENYDKKYYGKVTLRTALENSLNVATVKLAQEVGIDRIADIAEASGIRSPLTRVPSLALGTSEVTPLELANAYATIANGGVRVEPIAIKEVVDAEGRILERRTLDMSQVLSPQQAYILTSLLKGVVDQGTARSLRVLGFKHPAAGKTGTSSHYRDAWFSGFTPDLLALVWVGFDHDRSRSLRSDKRLAGVRLTGSEAAIPIWWDIMEPFSKGIQADDFKVPHNIVFREIDPKTGLLSTIGCPSGIREAFIKGSEPDQGCVRATEVPKGIWNWVRNLFKK